MVCLCCGNCCKYIVFLIPHKNYTQDELNYYNYRGIKFERVNRAIDRQIIPCKCNQLDENNKCKIFENRPDICNKSKRPSNQKVWIPPNCTDEI